MASKAAGRMVAVVLFCGIGLAAFGFGKYVLGKKVLTSGQPQPIGITTPEKPPATDTAIKPQLKPATPANPAVAPPAAQVAVTPVKPGAAATSSGSATPKVSAPAPKTTSGKPSAASTKPKAQPGHAVRARPPTTRTATKPKARSSRSSGSNTRARAAHRGPSPRVAPSHRRTERASASRPTRSPKAATRRTTRRSTPPRAGREPSGSSSATKVKPAGAPTVTPPAAGVTPRPKPYRVQVGSFTSRENSQRLAGELHSRGYFTYTRKVEKGGKTEYHVQVGAYTTREAAEKVRNELGAQGYDAYVSSK